MLQLLDLELQLAGQTLIHRFSLDIAKGEIVTLMGPSGCGKTSLLSGISGTLETPLHIKGAVLLNGKNLNALKPHKRRIGRMFQDDVLFPHLTIGENLLFGMPKGKHSQRLFAMRQGLVEIELDGFENRAPHTLSGGQRQRASLMRSLLAKPDCMVLDEPFSKLDQSLRGSIAQKTFEILKQYKIPTLLVTHHLDDAPMNGRILQITPEGKVVDVR